MDALLFNEAKISELGDILALLFDDKAGRKRERIDESTLPSYRLAFEAIGKDPNAHLITVKQNDIIIGIAQLNFIANLTYQGGVRAQIEGVRVHKDCRSQGIGKQLFEYLIEIAKQRGCHLVQLTTDKSRPEAYRFYQQLGFVNSHDGFKLHLVSKITQPVKKKS